MSDHFTFVDLFAGIGGFRLALTQLGGRCLGFSEINSDAIDAYCANFDEDTRLNLGDITQLKQLPEHDILTAGVPCQSWSIAGKNLGFDDDRGQLWNDTLYLLNQARPKAFIFENVKGLSDPRNQSALVYILTRIAQAGYFARHFVLNSSKYGVPQDRVRVYIIGFRNEDHLRKFRLPSPQESSIKLADILPEFVQAQKSVIAVGETIDLFDDGNRNKGYRQRHNMNDFFLFNDIRNGPTTLHSWDLLPVTERQQHICYLLLRNRRKKTYGRLDGNPLSLRHFQLLDDSIEAEELERLVDLGIFKKVPYTYSLLANESPLLLTQHEKLVLQLAADNEITLDALKDSRILKVERVPFERILAALVEKQILSCSEVRYEFRYTKISTGIEGINRIFLPKSATFPTLVASDTNDFVALKDIDADNEQEYKQVFLKEIFHKQLFRKIAKEEACLIQGFPRDFLLPEPRNRWMKLIGNSVSVPVVQLLAQAILESGCLGEASTLANSTEYLGISLRQVQNEEKNLTINESFAQAES